MLLFPASFSHPVSPLPHLFRIYVKSKVFIIFFIISHLRHIKECAFIQFSLGCRYFGGILTRIIRCLGVDIKDPCLCWNVSSLNNGVVKKGLK